MKNLLTSILWLIPLLVILSITTILNTHTNEIIGTLFLIASFSIIMTTFLHIENKKYTKAINECLDSIKENNEEFRRALENER